MQVIVFGATPSAKAVYMEIEQEYKIVALTDNDPQKWEGNICGYPVIMPRDIRKWDWDEIIIISVSAMDAIREQLLQMGISRQKINTRYVDLKIVPRRKWVENFALVIHEKNILGSVAEAGVFQGEFASVINSSFPEKILYLFDTFEGFDARDVIFEEKNGYSGAEAGHLNITSETLVLNRMKYPEKCIIKKGYFPETTGGINEKFCYVNLDMDLYKPTLEGLRFFWPLMVNGGIITIHDYFSRGYEGVNAAVREFLNEVSDDITPFPIGDQVSIAIQKR